MNIRSHQIVIYMWEWRMAYEPSETYIPSFPFQCSSPVPASVYVNSPEKVMVTEKEETNITHGQKLR